MKIRLGIAPPPAADFTQTVDLAEELGIDSLWISERVYDASIDPFIGMGHALSRTRALKVGFGVAILPGRHPVLVAKQLASLALLHPRRVLPAFGVSPARPRERDAFPVDGPRGEVFDEGLSLLRQLLRQERVTFKGDHYRVTDATVGPLPAKPLDLWVGGSAPAALRRAGRLSDGWLGSLLTPAEAGAAREEIQRHAAEAGREIEPDHFGLSIAVALGDVSDDLLASIRRRRPDADPAALVPAGWAAARAQVERYVAAGLTKFVVRPAGREPGLREFLDGFNRELTPLQN
ncbi:TIGR03854 family LLM class F420-dependent oxidoreductase [Nonomuraea sediminis]|uniref:TIGR03854 family LLM class F420-dependent oxidoreductase n=1 Tax=Nonomuraea sediminis TaxID=2835864 RepID=UPI001BDD3C3F|nr:TIGR03854 family LLM class F420-dependent oxidoreductase [Nonomuraea sediminis]